MSLLSIITCLAFPLSPNTHSLFFSLFLTFPYLNLPFQATAERGVETTRALARSLDADCKGMVADADVIEADVAALQLQRAELQRQLAAMRAAEAAKASRRVDAHASTTLIAASRGSQSVSSGSDADVAWFVDVQDAKFNEYRDRLAEARDDACFQVGGANALVTFICVLCTLRTQISRSICNFTHYINNYNINLTINMQLYTLYSGACCGADAATETTTTTTTTVASTNRILSTLTACCASRGGR
jgi:hypothetical protein